MALDNTLDDNLMSLIGEVEVPEKELLEIAPVPSAIGEICHLTLVY